jgi:hypothetical protein
MDSNESGNLSSDKKGFDERFAPHLRRRLEMVLEECTFKEPARIRSVNFDAKKDVMSLDVAWPFRLPYSSGDSGDSFGTEKDIQALQTGFRKHLLQQKIGRKLSNMLQKEFEDFLIVHLRIKPFGEKLVSVVKTRATRRLAGRPTQLVNKADDAVIRGKVNSIKATLDRMKAKIKVWMKKNPTLDNDKILKRVSSDFSAEMQGWLSIFRRKVRALPMRELRTGVLADVGSWSSRELAAQIAHDYFSRLWDLAPTLGELRKMASSATRKKVKTK